MENNVIATGLVGEHVIFRLGDKFWKVSSSNLTCPREQLSYFEAQQFINSKQATEYKVPHL